MTDLDQMTDHYEKPGLLTRIDFGLKASGIDPKKATRRDLAPVDEFHLRGPVATDELIDLLQPQADWSFLDLGAGLGGPARHLADRSGCRVTGIDLAEEFCKVGNELSRRMGLHEKVSLQPGDITDLSRFLDAEFDAAWIIHVGMYIQDKLSFYKEVHRVLKPGGKYLVFDAVRVDGQEVTYPMPWAADASSSFLASHDEMHALLSDAGFKVCHEEDQREAARDFLKKSSEKAQAAGVTPPLGLHLIFGPVAKKIFPNLLGNLIRGTMGPRVYLCEKS
ncbi:class I SAM-dependent methyltransferase [Rhodovibrionaceae bacterium A322]